MLQRAQCLSMWINVIQRLTGAYKDNLTAAALISGITSTQVSLPVDLQHFYIAEETITINCLNLAAPKIVVKMHFPSNCFDLSS